MMFPTDTGPAVSAVLTIVSCGNWVIVVVAALEVVGAVCDVSNVAVFENVPPLSMLACVTA